MPPKVSSPQDSLLQATDGRNQGGCMSRYDSGRRRAYQAAPNWLRCVARAMTFANGKEQARCMRYYDERYHRNVSFQHRCCAQHAEMLFAGKTVIDFENGQPLVLPRRRAQIGDDDA